MSNILKLKLNTISSRTPLEKNLQKVLNWGNEDTQTLKKSFGLLKSTSKKKLLAQQKKLRNELDR